MASLVTALSKNPLARIAESSKSQFETDFVENSLRKFAKLLQIAFGEAGAGIIGQNLSQDGDVDPMVEGRCVWGGGGGDFVRRVQAVFGFCDIRNFTDCTECLQEEVGGGGGVLKAQVMLFVNRIAQIVHTAADENFGAPNKNIGDAFLLAWRLREDDAEKITEGALKTIIRCTLELNASDILRHMVEHPKLQERLPGYRVRTPPPPRANSPR
jgi:hypothetical protein